MRLLTIAKHEDRVLIPRIHEPNQMWTCHLSVPTERQRTETEEAWSTSASSPDTDIAEDRNPDSHKVEVTSDLHVLLTNIVRVIYNTHIRGYRCLLPMLLPSLQSRDPSHRHPDYDTHRRTYEYF